MWNRSKPTTRRVSTSMAMKTVQSCVLAVPIPVPVQFRFRFRSPTSRSRDPTMASRSTTADVVSSLSAGRGTWPLKGGNCHGHFSQKSRSVPAHFGFHQTCGRDHQAHPAGARASFRPIAAVFHQHGFQLGCLKTGERTQIFFPGTGPANIELVSFRLDHTAGRPGLPPKDRETEGPKFF